ncbi:MAG TPA: PIG-L family deacetylase [Bacteroidota bacterium]|nr:PIG-L family deacetylase [Bacteroidota bacterium]
MRIHTFHFCRAVLVCALVLLLTGGSAGRSSPFPNHRQDQNLVLMCLSAHPDDEDGATLAYYSRLKGVKTYSIFFTRGEGGQNETGSELYGDLGIVRTKETLEAAKILGSEVYFLGFPDFGFSKTAKETFAKWGGKDSVLARLVYVIRALKPDVIITNHDTVTTKPNRQHGNHQVVGITAYEAFAKAADPSFHPEQLNDSITVWQVRKLYNRSFRRGASADTSTDEVVLDMSVRDPGGTPIDELALEALRKHRSQGMDKLVMKDIPPFFRMHRYRLLCSNGNFPFDQHDLFSGIEPSARNRAAIMSWNISSRGSTDEFRPYKGNAVFTPGITIGLVFTYDSTLEETMTSCGIPYRLVDSSALAAGNLMQFSTIILDLRTYEFRSDAARYNDRLLEYVRNGGNLICCYHKLGDWNGKNYAPYPLALTSERVTEEDALVTSLLPDQPLLNKPNRILPDDWNGWVQERSIYLPSDDTSRTSPRYLRILAMSDESETQPPTSLLWCAYGKGTYTYISLALYRQLRIANEGAVKLFFNLISQHQH